MASTTVKRNNTICAILVILLVCVAAGSLAVGKYPLSLEKILAGDEMQRKVFYTLRMSRTAVAVFGGAVLGICGFVYQTVFRNPLASPDIIGVSSGASLGAAVGILCFGSTVAITVSAFAGAVLAVCLALLLSAADRTGRKSTIVLAGIAVHALAQTALMCMKTTADPERELASIEYWIMGSLAGVTSSKIGSNLLICILATVALIFLHRQTILLSADEGEARMLGVSVRKNRFIVLLLATLAVSAVVSLTGLISFIGLLAPHIARLITKNNSISTMLFSGLTGGILLCGADILARSTAQTELPVSIFTSLIGVPLLIFLTLKGRNVS
ncbi:MAG: iron ABC transporter permease [Oscillospiraceae bacterium]|nr:iron ABC transporter permease [Oscillospiraceae bacterium]